MSQLFSRLFNLKMIRKTITVKTNSLNVVESVEELLIMTPAWRENIVIDYSPAAAD